MSSIIQRMAIDEEKLKSALASDQGEAGPFLQYDLIYDQIKEARREDDETLSQGIWQTDLKRADWPLVESLCIDSLENKTKDLQLLGWLCESWIVLDHLPGFQRGIHLMTELLVKFWDTIHPLPEDGDYEYRLRILDWCHENLANRLIFVPVVEGSDFTMNLADWIDAVNLDLIVKRSQDGKSLLAKAESSNRMTLNKFRYNLKKATFDSLKCTLKETEDAQKALSELTTCLREKLGPAAPVFLKIKTNLDDILRICKTGLEILESEQNSLRAKNQAQEIPSESIENLLTDHSENASQNPSENVDDNTLTVNGRSEAYQALSDIGAFLKSLDPHSPAPYLIELVVKWQNKSLVEILSELPKQTEGPYQLLRVLGNAANQQPIMNVPPPPQVPSTDQGFNMINPAMFKGGHS